MPQSDVSVVIPAYRASHTICRAIDSVVNQTVSASEIIVVDDGSPEDLASTVAAYGECVNLIRKENGGAASARDVGIQQAKSNFVAFLDADDYWEPGKLEEQFRIFEQHPDLGLVASAYFEQKPQETRSLATWNPGKYADRVVDVRESREAFSVGCLAWTSTVMVSREALGPQQFVSGLEPAEDRDMWIRLAATCPVYLMSKPLATAVLEEGSLSRTQIDRDCGNMLRVVHRHRDLLGAKAIRKWEAHVYRRWAAGHLAAGNGRAAVPFAFRRLRRNLLALESWWIVAKSLVWSCMR